MHCTKLGTLMVGMSVLKSFLSFPLYFNPFGCEQVVGGRLGVVESLYFLPTLLLPVVVPSNNYGQQSTLKSLKFASFCRVVYSLVGLHYFLLITQYLLGPV